MAYLPLVILVTLISPLVSAQDVRASAITIERGSYARIAFVGNAVYKYLRVLSPGTGEPRPSARLEFTAVELVPAGAKISRRPSQRIKQHCRTKRCGIGWRRAEARHGIFD